MRGPRGDTACVEAPRESEVRSDSRVSHPVRTEGSTAGRSHLLLHGACACLQVLPLEAAGADSPCRDQQGRGIAHWDWASRRSHPVSASQAACAHTRTFELVIVLRRYVHDSSACAGMIHPGDRLLAIDGDLVAQSSWWSILWSVVFPRRGRCVQDLCKSPIGSHSVRPQSLRTCLLDMCARPTGVWQAVVVQGSERL